MSVRIWIVVTTLLAAVAPICPLRAQALDFAYPFSDPLRTLPVVMDTGAMLPGDTDPIPRSYDKPLSSPLALTEAVDLALSHNQKVRGAWADIKVQAAALGQENAAYLPTVTGTLNWVNDNISSSNSSSTKSYTSQASARWRLFDFGGRSAGKNAADNLLAAAVATHDSALQQALSGVIQAYFDAVTAGASLKAKVKNEEIAITILTYARYREAKGIASRLDTLRAITALARATLEKSRADGYYRKAEAMLKYSIGVPSTTVLLLPTEFDENSANTVTGKELSAWLEETLRNHPAIVAARKQRDAAIKQVAVARSSGLPTMDLSGAFSQGSYSGVAVSPGSMETTVTVAIAIPIFDGFATTYKVRGAEAKVEKETAALTDVEQQIIMGVIKAYGDASSALLNLDASVALLKAAQGALEVSQRKYDKGAADITEVLSTQTALADAWNERIRTQAEWQSARLQLLTSAGKMGRSVLINGEGNLRPDGGGSSTK